MYLSQTKEDERRRLSHVTRRPQKGPGATRGACDCADLRPLAINNKVHPEKHFYSVLKTQSLAGDAAFLGSFCLDPMTLSWDIFSAATEGLNGTSFFSYLNHRHQMSDFCLGPTEPRRKGLSLCADRDEHTCADAVRRVERKIPPLSLLSARSSTNIIKT